ncbi:MAG: class I adenylate-forming enzyme family protein [Gemmataceae bacterium]
MNMDFSAILEESASRHADKLAVLTSERSLTYSALADKVSRMAGHLADAGFSPGDRVAMLLPNDLELVICLLAATRAELIAVPIATGFATPQIDYILRNSGARVLVTTPRLLEKVSKEARSNLESLATTEPCSGAEHLGEWLAHETQSPIRTFRDPIGLLVYTSGTTSRPKGVAHTQKRMSHRVDLFVQEMGLSSEDATIGTVEVGRPMFLLGQLLPMLRVGGQIHLLPNANAEKFWAFYGQARPTYMLTPSGIGTQLLEHPEALSADHGNLRFWITGGDKAPTSLFGRMKKVAGKPLLELCGMTETGFYAINPHRGPIKQGSIGLAMRGVAVRLVDESRADVPTGKTGNLLVRTSDMMLGYWNDTLLTHRSLHDGWLETGDLVMADEDGYLWFMGRAKNMIDRGGFKVAPPMVEEALESHPSVDSAIVVGISDPQFGQLPFAFYQLRPGADDPGANTLLAWAAERLEPQALPVGFTRMENWPRTAQGKIDRSRLVWIAEAGGQVL